MAFDGAYRSRRVLVTGHTGFKGAWLTEWLLSLGAEVAGFALPPPTTPALFEQLGLDRRIRHVEADVRDLSAIRKVVESFQPAYVFHLAAQPLVRLSYEKPVETYATNVMGTVNVLEAVRHLQRPCVVVCVTTDKCYENREWLHSYREEDPLGGHDPYSSSKAAAEIAITAYRRSYWSFSESPVKVASARAGNVIGGGDWALDRIVPDCMRSLARQETIRVRNSQATRPWQHVLEPLSGYLWLAACLADPRLAARQSNLCSAFNFGPPLDSNRTVLELVEEVLQHWPGRWVDGSDSRAVHEATLLNLATDKSHHVLRWSPTWGFAQTVQRTVEWYRQAMHSQADVQALTAQHIEDFTAAARGMRQPWAAAPAPPEAS